MSRQAVRAVVFDLFDTLVDLQLEAMPRVERGGRRLPSSLPMLHEVVCARTSIGFDAFADLLQEVDRGFRESHYAQGVELPTRQRFETLVARLGLDDPALATRLTDAHMRIFREHSVAPAHHGALLGRLRRRARLGLCSNFSHSATARHILEAQGLREHLDAVAISETVGIRKPRREIFEAVLAELGVAPAEALHVGDSLRADVAGAAALGMRTAWLTRRVADPEASRREHPGPPPDLEIADLAELEGML